MLTCFLLLMYLWYLNKMQKIFLWVACLAATTICNAEVDEMKAYAAAPVTVDKGNKFSSSNDSAIAADMTLSDRENLSDIEQSVQRLDESQIQEQNRNSQKNTAIDPIKLKSLAKHSQWQHLLFYKNGKAEVISPDFYLTNPKPRSKRNFDPYAELIATIEQINNEGVVCKYLARYLWLNHHLPELNVDLKNCSKCDLSLDLELL